MIGKPYKKTFVKNPIQGTKFTLAISSAKGGVGKSTFATNLALALKNLGCDVKINKQIHWEINCPEDSENVLKQIETSGELFNSNKEFLSELPKDQDTHSVLVRQKDDMHCQKKFNSLKQRKPEKIIERAVWGMLPKNRLGRAVLKKLHIYPDTNHPHQSQNPKELVFNIKKVEENA